MSDAFDNKGGDGTGEAAATRTPRERAGANITQALAMYSTDELVKKHQRQMQSLRRELDATARKRRSERRNLDMELSDFRKQWAIHPPKPKRTPLPLRVLSILF